MRHILPAGDGLAVPLEKGQLLRVVNTHGGQVVDLWAFAPADDDEHLSMGHCRELLQRVFFAPGDRLVTNRYRAALTFTADTSPGLHDTLIAACSPAMYAHLGADPAHRSCTANLEKALNRPLSFVPQPWNLFMVARLDDRGRIEYERPVSRPGDHVELRAEMDLLVGLSSCPDDVYPTNGGDGRPHDVAVEVVG